MAQKKKHMGMEGAPYWYNTPLDKLDFEWSTEEALELERYCEKILKNVTEEEMLPLDRWKAHIAGKPADRKTIQFHPKVTYATRTLDGYADALRPIDCYRHPKLMVKAKVSSSARFKSDFVSWAMITYTEGLWGGHAKMIDYGNPSMVGEPPIKTREDLEKAEVPNPYEDGLYPGYIWAVREIRRLHDKYKLPMPLWVSMCPGPIEVMQLGMMGWNPVLKAIRKDPEFAQAAADKANVWCKRFAHALVDVGRTEAIYCCQFTGGFPMRGGAEWVADKWKELGDDIKAYSMKKNKINVHLSHGYSFLSGCFEWYDCLHEHGAMTRECWDGGMDGRGEVDMLKVLAWHRDNDILLGYSSPSETLEKGPIQKIIDEQKQLCAETRSHRRFTPMLNLTYWQAPAHVDAAFAALKQYAKL